MTNINFGIGPTYVIPAGLLNTVLRYRKCDLKVPKTVKTSALNKFLQLLEKKYKIVFNSTSESVSSIFTGIGYLPNNVHLYGRSSPGAHAVHLGYCKF